MIFLYIVLPSAQSLTVDSVFLQTSLANATNSRGPNMLPYGTPDVTLPHIIAHILSLRTTHTLTTTFECTPENSIFVTSRSCGTKSKAFDKHYPHLAAAVLNTNCLANNSTCISDKARNFSDVEKVNNSKNW